MQEAHFIFSIFLKFVFYFSKKSNYTKKIVGITWIERRWFSPILVPFFSHLKHCISFGGGN
jgi:hypothetical protein